MFNKTPIKLIVNTITLKYNSCTSLYWPFVKCIHSSKRIIEEAKITETRNIGILAHIDAGKTTTTERMLFYSGVIPSVGEVHHGNTVTDYMEQERARGITITSAAVSFAWNSHRINLIDTPGHIDFTVEVERALRVLDGAIVVLDSSAGVEAQTSTVWRQANEYGTPRIVYCNKMDRPDASISKCICSIKSKLHALPVPLQYPIGKGKQFQGIVDLVQMEKLIWNPNQSERGKMFSKTVLSEKDDDILWEEAYKYREEMIGILADLDNDFAETVLELESVDSASASDITAAARRVTLSCEGIPVLCGSSYKNIGVQALMDSVVLYLPTPLDKQQKFVSVYGTHLCAMAFKVIHDPQRGQLTFVRIYSGVLNAGQKIYNVNQHATEVVTKVLLPCGDDFEEVDQVTTGNIGVVTGLKVVITGDTLTNSQTAANDAKRKGARDKDSLAAESDPILAGVHIPDPVFFCSIEPPSLSSQLQLEFALKCLQKEDPSLKVSTNEETGQIVISGMGELHLDIIKDRILKEYKVDAELGPLQIAYKETMQQELRDTYTLSRRVGASKHDVTIELSVYPSPEEKGLSAVGLDRSHNSELDVSKIRPQTLRVIQTGIDVALLNGPLLRCNVINVKTMLHKLLIGRGTSETMISAAATQCISKMLKNAEMILLEPMMSLSITVPETYATTILADLSKRRSSIEQVTVVEDLHVIEATTPLAELVGYSTVIRTLSSGSAIFSMEFSKYSHMTSRDQQQTIQRVIGF